MLISFTFELAYKSAPPIGANMMPIAKKMGRTVLGVRMGCHAFNLSRSGYHDQYDITEHGSKFSHYRCCLNAVSVSCCQRYYSDVRGVCVACSLVFSTSRKSPSSGLRSLWSSSLFVPSFRSAFLLIWLRRNVETRKPWRGERGCFGVSSGSSVQHAAALAYIER